MKIAFYTLGCKVNTYESESTWELFKKEGYERVNSTEFADVYVINTCTVTNNGDVKSRKAIRKLIKKNPEAVIAVMGCYSQLQPEVVLAIEGVDIVIGTTHREQLPVLVKEHLNERKRISDVIDVSRYRRFDEVHVSHFTENTRAFLKIQDGCNNFCTYCIIPFARGPVRSRPPQSVLAEAKELVENGYKEIVLTGIHTGGYGSDLDKYSFYDLLVELSAIVGLERLRISSIEMNELSPDIIELIATNPVFTKHLHIPLQSGSEHILSQMNRKYTKEEYKQRINEIREKVPGIAITTDVIVGFPGETEDMFQEMVDFIKEISFSELHVFPYSKRSGTKAANMKNHINGLVKSFRVNQLLMVNQALATAYINTKEDVEVLFETSDDTFTYGHTDTYIKVLVDKDETLHNQLKVVELQQKTYGNVYGKIKKAKS